MYDEDKYEELKKRNKLEDMEEINIINYSSSQGICKVVFTFDKTVSRIRIEISALDENKSKNILIKNMKYGFSKMAYREEVIRKIEENEEREEIEKSGMYDDILYSLDFIDENGEEIMEDEENIDDRSEDYYDEYDRSYEDDIRDRFTGPAFDEKLKSEISYQDFGPAFINVSTFSNVK
ncbi:MAG: hypothetical protein IJ593_09290 [Lachnospiraceae bacterium]|nr:hypothetical protein [Lachnospiraceae bacterium]